MARTCAAASARRCSVLKPTGSWHPGIGSERTQNRPTETMPEGVCMPLDEHLVEWLLKTPGLFEQLFDSLPDVLFYIKDRQGQYLWVNDTLVRRSGLGGRKDVIGRTADQLFPVSGPSTMAQDLEVVRTQRPIRELLRLYRTSKGER